MVTMKSTPAAGRSRLSSKDGPNNIVRLFLFLFCLYAFFLSIGAMEAAFKGFGAEFSKRLLTISGHPFVGLFIGLLATSIIQSSSTTTSLIVALVASGALNVANAVPMVMGANIGTSVTNTLVSIGHITRATEFRRAFAAATVHDFFNIMAVIIFLPLELLTGYLRKTATSLAGFLIHSGGLTFTSPLKAIIKPVIKQLSAVLNHMMLNPGWAGLALLILGLAGLFISLYGVTKVMRALTAGRMEMVFNRLLGRSALVGMSLGMICTAIVQSSSVTTSLMVPLAGAGIIGLTTVFPITLGANVGTTITAILAALATESSGGLENSGLVIALCHLLFNASGIALIYPVPAVRKIPITLARLLSIKASRKKIYALIYILTIFFLLPITLIAVTHTHKLTQLLGLS